MNIKEEISNIEHRLRLVFDKDRITKLEVNECNLLLERWKELTNYVPKEEPVVYSIIDEDPEWMKQKIKQQSYENNQR